FDGFESDPAIALEKLRRLGLKSGVIEPLVGEVPVHAIEPAGNPAAARLQERNADLRVTLAHTAPDHRHACQHHFHRMGDDMARTTLLEAVHADLHHPAVAAF